MIIILMSYYLIDLTQETTTLAQEIRESQLMEEKHLVIRELMNQEKKN